MRISTIIILLTLCFSSLFAQQSEAPSSTTAVAWSRDGMYLAIGTVSSAAYSVQIYNTISDTAIKTFNVPGEVMGLGWSFSNQYLATRFRSEVGNNLVVWDLEAGVEYQIDEVDTHVCDNNVYWANTLDLIALPYCSAVTIWNPATQTQVSVLNNWDIEADGIVRIAWSKDDSRIYAGFEAYRDNIVRWDISTGQVTSLVDHGLLLTAFALHPNEMLAAVGDSEGFVTIYNLETAAVEAKFEVFEQEQYIVPYLTWNDSDNLLGVRYDGVMSHWNVKEGRLVKRVATSNGEYGSVRDIDLSPFGGRLALAWWITDYFAIPTGLLPLVSPVKTYADEADVIVPTPSLDHLNAIAELCDASLQPIDSLDALPDFVAQVESLPEGAIPAACRADLLAVADALR